MAKGNYSAMSEFILLGLTDNLELQATLFRVFLVICLASVLDNLGLIVLIQVSPQLHAPMYFFFSAIWLLLIFLYFVCYPKHLGEFSV